MSTPTLVLGFSGTKCVGKDSLFRHLHALDPRFRRWAYADQLKKDLAPLIREQFGFDPDNLTPEQKEIVRHLYIGYGMAWRSADPLHWVRVVVEQVASSTVSLVCITDNRFPNEVSFCRGFYGDAFKLIDITRSGSPPPTDEEEKHFRQVAAMADFHLHWGNDTEEQQRERAREVLSWLGLS